MTFKIGMRVKYIKECHDHHSNSDGLVLNEIYTINDYDGRSIHLAEVSWWVDQDCVILFDNPREWICRKVREMNKRRKELGYAF